MASHDKHNAARKVYTFSQLRSIAINTTKAASIRTRIDLRSVYWQFDQVKEKQIIECSPLDNWLRELKTIKYLVLETLNSEK